MQATHVHEHHHHEHDHSHGPDVQGWLKVGILLGLGLYFAYNILTGNLTNYINARFAWLSYLAAGLFLLLGVSGVVGLVRARGQHDHDHHDHDHGHDHNHGQMSWGMLAVVAIPLVLGTLVPSRPLGADAITGEVSLNAASTSTITASAANIPPLERNVLDWLRLFNATGDYQALNGEPADVIGFVYREPTFGENQFMVARFTVSCCVADASAIGLPVQWADAESLPADTWVRVRGQFQSGEFRGDNVPVLIASTIDEVKQPEHPYLYP